MPLSRRYSPEKPAAESALFGLDYSAILPPGVGIVAGTVAVFTNTAFPADAAADWQIGPVEIRGRAIYARLSGGIDGTDYQIRWNCTDTEGNTWPRTVMVLCAPTS